MMDVYKYEYDLMDGMGALHWEAFMEKHTEPLLYNITIIEHVNVPFNHGLVLGQL
jgi:hypothetical protein